MKVKDYYKRKGNIKNEFEALKQDFIRANSSTLEGEIMTDERGRKILVEKVEVADNIFDPEQDFVALRYWGKKIKRDGKPSTIGSWIYVIVKQ